MNNYFLFIILLFAVSLFILQTNAHKRYVSLLPNGSKIKLEGKTCKATGHLTCSGHGKIGKKVNKFSGYLFLKNFLS